MIIKPTVNTTRSGGLVQPDDPRSIEVYSGSRFYDQVGSLSNKKFNPLDIIYVHDGYWPLNVWSAGMQPHCLPLNWSLL